MCVRPPCLPWRRVADDVVEPGHRSYLAEALRPYVPPPNCQNIPGALTSPSALVYRKYGSDTVSIVPFLSGHAQLYSGNLDVARQVVAGGVKSSWIKPERVSQGLM